MKLYNENCKKENNNKNEINKILKANLEQKINELIKVNNLKIEDLNTINKFNTKL